MYVAIHPPVCRPSADPPSTLVCPPPIFSWPHSLTQRPGRSSCPQTRSTQWLTSATCALILGNAWRIECLVSSGCKNNLALTAHAHPRIKRYDKLPKERPQQMRQQPTMVLFQNLSPLAFKEHSYTIFVFVTADGVADETLGLPAEGDLEDLYFSHTNFAGITSVFGARGERCDNCLMSDPFHIAVDITEAVTALNLDRFGVNVHIRVRSPNRTLACPIARSHPTSTWHGARGWG